ncbi:hypothetical protein MASR2M39_04920 [Ignavibacteriales bacterium]
MKLGGLEHVLDHLLYIKRIMIIACGTSWHSALVGKYMFETFSEFPLKWNMRVSSGTGIR